MKYYKQFMLLSGMTIVLFPSVLMASYFLGSDNHVYPEVIQTPLGPAGVPENNDFDNERDNENDKKKDDTGGKKNNRNSQNHSAFNAAVISIGYGWIRVIAPDGSSQITCSSGLNYNRTGTIEMVQNEDMIDFKFTVAMNENKEPKQLNRIFSSPFQYPEKGSARTLLLASASGSGSSTGGCPVNYFLPPNSEKSKTQVKCQTRYDPVAGKWVVRYVVVFVMQPKDAKVQKVTKSGAISYVDIDNKGRGMDFIK